MTLAHTRRRSYLRNTITGNVFGTYEPEAFFGSSNRFSDGTPVYARATKAEWEAYLRSIETTTR